MIKILNITGNTVELKPDGKIQEGDFLKIAKEVDPLIKENKNIQLCLHAASFSGWSSFQAFSEHINFVKSHHKSVKKIAIVKPHFWQRLFFPFTGLFLHPTIKIFDTAESAKRWLSIPA